MSEAGSEKQADLAMLQAMAGEEVPQVVGGEAPPEMDPAEAWAMLPAMVGSIFAIVAPELRAVYSQEACRAWGSAMVPVADKYGWSHEGLMGPELALAAASLPFVLGTVAAVKSRRAEEKAGQGRQVEKKAEPAAPGADTVIIGAPVVA